MLKGHMQTQIDEIKGQRKLRKQKMINEPCTDSCDLVISMETMGALKEQVMLQNNGQLYNFKIYTNVNRKKMQEKWQISIRHYVDTKKRGMFKHFTQKINQQLTIRNACKGKLFRNINLRKHP